MPERIRLVRVAPAKDIHGAGLQEIIESLQEVLGALGYAVDAALNQPLVGATNIYFLAHLLEEEQMEAVPTGSILYNFEQVNSCPLLQAPAFLKLTQRCEIWDYSLKNLRALPLSGIDQRLRYVPVGYTGGLTRVKAAPCQDVDVLFYGSLNERRRIVLDQLREKGLKVHHLFGIYGAERDAFIARSKVVLNLHFYPCQILETVRVSYLMANSKAVVSERDPESEFCPTLLAGLAAGPYDEIALLCAQLVEDESARRSLERRALETIRKIDLSSILKEALSPMPDTGETQDMLYIANLDGLPPAKLGGLLGALQILAEENPQARFLFRGQHLQGESRQLLDDFAGLCQESEPAPGSVYTPRVLLSEQAHDDFQRTQLWMEQQGFRSVTVLDSSVSLV